MLTTLEPVDLNNDVSWDAVDARLDTSTDELHVSITVDGEEQEAVVIAALPLDGRTPARLTKHLEPAPGCSVALAF